MNTSAKGIFLIRMLLFLTKTHSELTKIKVRLSEVSYTFSSKRFYVGINQVSQKYNHYYFVNSFVTHKSSGASSKCLFLFSLEKFGGKSVSKKYEKIVLKKFEEITDNFKIFINKDIIDQIK